MWLLCVGFHKSDANNFIYFNITLFYIAIYLQYLSCLTPWRRQSNPICSRRLFLFFIRASSLPVECPAAIKLLAFSKNDAPEFKYCVVVVLLFGFCANIAEILPSHSCELKRILSITLSPIYAHFFETLTGIVTIRAFRQLQWYEWQKLKIQ